MKEDLKTAALLTAAFLLFICLTIYADRRDSTGDTIKASVSEATTESITPEDVIRITLITSTEEASTEEETFCEYQEEEETYAERLDSDTDYSDDYDADYDVQWGVTREDIISYAAETYGVSEDWTIWLIGTTHNEGYQQDRYLEYAWACEIINVYSGWSVYDLDCIWGSYYSIEHAYSGYYNADDTTLEMVWEALTDTDTRIVEVDGMIDYYVPGYYLIYDSPVYNCQVWGG